ncbi:hypothetical protein NOR51B_1341 [Luminiphilus syltensis NOR5-1B]|uniref:Uncharacterized protein n=1 Tax=Luminiphilus syltensis NOR5-1B TaxID=565045 RepID=B8KW74_9GAMM|nr:hypothetical protein NOR51B_1341 [Luminiphilus syltensis NOR5-1B]
MKQCAEARVDHAVNLGAKKIYWDGVGWGYNDRQNLGGVEK